MFSTSLEYYCSKGLGEIIPRHNIEPRGVFGLLLPKLSAECQASDRKQSRGESGPLAVLRAFHKRASKLLLLFAKHTCPTGNWGQEQSHQLEYWLLFFLIQHKSGHVAMQ